jgi:hypothetical protein
MKRIESNVTQMLEISRKEFNMINVLKVTIEKVDNMHE